MDALFITHGVGLDIHKKVIVATVLTPDLTETRTFGSVTEELLALGNWLMACRVTYVAMEATGVYGKLVVNLLESYEFTAVWVVNPHHITGMPGRKTDVQDSHGIAYLLRLDALKGSDIPSRSQRELQEIVRYRKSLIQLRATEANRIQKVLEGANVKLSRVFTDVLGGVTGQRILAAALCGVVQRHQQLMLRVQLELITFLDCQIATLNTKISAPLANFDDALTRLETIPGVGRRTTQTIIAEVGGRYATVFVCPSFEFLGGIQSRAKRKCQQNASCSRPSGQ